ncbi:MAG: hypothetical protein NC218_04660 [Acetobacter sp.]|nr:hypothetical protein [Acetobacter sp.]
MNKFYHYWRFFADNKFPQGTDLKFFNDGGFAITVNNVVSLYSNAAVLIARYENAFALENGCICERYHENLIVHYDDTQYPIPCPSDTKLLQYENAVEVTVSTITGERRLYFITPEYKDLRFIPLKDDVKVDNTSADGKAVLRYSPSKAELIGNDGHPIELGCAFHRIDFLRRGHYIVHFSSGDIGATLYNAENEACLQSERDYGILPLGDYVQYENALIADSYGNFVSEYNREIAVYYNDIFVSPYTIRQKLLANTFFWPGGKMMCFRNCHIGTVLGYWHTGHFYFAPIGIKERYKDSEFVGFTKPLQRYLKRIEKIMILH